VHPGDLSLTPIVRTTRVAVPAVVVALPLVLALVLALLVALPVGTVCRRDRGDERVFLTRPAMIDRRHGRERSMAYRSGRRRRRRRDGG
jgi:hypothetical protein